MNKTIVTGHGIYYLCPDDTFPTGGQRVIYRHVEILRSAGIEAWVLHAKAGFRCQWFASDAPVTCIADARLRPADYLVAPEILGPDLADAGRGVRTVVFNQGAYNTFAGYSFDPADRRCAYTNPRVIATLVVSQDSQRYLQFAFPQALVRRIRLSVDPRLFHPAAKRRRIAFMPRRRAEEAVQVINLLKFHGALEGWELTPIADIRHEQVAAILRESMIFLSFAYPEGFGLPSLEAIASGCVTIGYHGGGGAEFFTPENGYPIAQGDVINFAQTAQRIAREMRDDPTAQLTRAAAASQRICREYSPEIEVSDVITAWREIFAISS